MRQIQRGQLLAVIEHTFHSRYICRGEFARVPRQRRHGRAIFKHGLHGRNTAGIQKPKVHFGAPEQIVKPISAGGGLNLRLYHDFCDLRIPILIGLIEVVLKNHVIGALCAIGIQGFAGLHHVCSIAQIQNNITIFLYDSPVDLISRTRCKNGGWQHANQHNNRDQYA